MMINLLGSPSGKIDEIYCDEGVLWLRSLPPCLGIPLQMRFPDATPDTVLVVFPCDSPGTAEVLDDD